MKRCGKCHKDKPLVDFHHHARDGHQSQCKPCRSGVGGSHKRRYDLEDTDHAGPEEPRWPGPFFDHVSRRRVAAATLDPPTPFAALQSCGPFVDPELSALERIAQNESMADAIDTLDDRSRYVIEALFWRRVTLRDLALDMSLSKTHVARIRDLALVTLGGALAPRDGFGD